MNIGPGRVFEYLGYDGKPARGLIVGGSGRRHAFVPLEQAVELPSGRRRYISSTDPDAVEKDHKYVVRLFDGPAPLECWGRTKNGPGKGELNAVAFAELKYVRWVSEAAFEQEIAKAEDTPVSNRDLKRVLDPLWEQVPQYETTWRNVLYKLPKAIEEELELAELEEVAPIGSSRSETAAALERKAFADRRREQGRQEPARQEAAGGYVRIRKGDTVELPVAGTAGKDDTQLES